MTSVLNAVKEILSAHFNSEICKYILIGSRIENAQKDNSDYDVIIVTKDNVDSYELIKKITPFLSLISFKFKVIIGIYPVKQSSLQITDSQFIKNINTKGIEF